MTQTGAIQLIEDELGTLIGIKSGEDDRVGNSGFDVLIDRETQVGEQRGLADQNKVMIFGEVFEQETQFTQTVDVHEMGVIDDGGEHFTELIQAKGFLDEAAFTFKVPAVEVDAEGFAEDAQRSEVGMERAGYDGSDQAFGVMLFEGFLDDGFAGAGFTQQ
jgi:hypothetical protein